MGVYIKGMEMSEIENIVLTKNVQLVFCWTSDMKITVKTRAESDSGIVAYSKEFDVVEVPEPHGALIDKSELMERELGWYKERVVRMDESVNIFVTHAIQGIDKSPTVIEAEGE